MRLLKERALLLLLSIVSLIIPIFIGFSTIPSQNDLFRNSIVSLAYIIINILGVLAAFYPRFCSTHLNSLTFKGIEGEKTDLKGSHKYLGKSLNHHPLCAGFQSHEFKLARRSICVGCSGLIVGAAISSILVATYFRQLWLYPEIAKVVLIIGVLFVASGLAQSLLFDIKWKIQRFLFNTFLVVGFAFTLIGEDILRRNLLIDSYILILSLLWLYIRVRSSKLSHQRVCGNCHLDCPDYE